MIPEKIGSRDSVPESQLPGPPHQGGGQSSPSPAPGTLSPLQDKLLNVFLFLFFGGAAVQRVYQTSIQGTFDYVEISFALQNAALIWFVLVRVPHKAVNPNLWHQGVALVAFFSGLAFVDIAPPEEPMLRLASKVTVLISNILGVVVLFNLGGSFGILIARREIKTRGLYSIVRHPMYLTDILLRVGYLVGNANPRNIVLFAGSTLCYVYRAILEEKFLSQSPEYLEFMSRVRYRFIPYVF